MDKVLGQKRAIGDLHKVGEPFDQRMIDVGDGHSLYLEQSGRPDGLPVVVLHGGPGGGCSPWMRRYFDPEIYRVILFDQRGCGRSRPHASIEANTTWHLVADIERIRAELGIDKWVVFGGSWGATLALIYGQEHTKHVSALILRGVFLMTRKELDWFYNGGAGQFWPDHWQKFIDPIPENERDDLIGAYHRRLFSGNSAEEVCYAKTWTMWENSLSSIDSDGPSGSGPAQYARAFARIENHYFKHRGWLTEDAHIMNRMDRLANIPGYIVQGRYDMICPPQTAWELAKVWPGADLRMVAKSGHALSEVGITAELLEIMNKLHLRSDISFL